MSPQIRPMLCRAVLAAAILLAGLSPAFGDSGYRINLAFVKSTHPDSERKDDYSTNHPSAGVTGPVAGKWLRWGAGMARNSHSRWGPWAGLTGTFELAENWRAGLNVGAAGNYSRGFWFRGGALPIVQWKAPDSEYIWEFGAVRSFDATFAGVGVHVPFSALGTKRTD